MHFEFAELGLVVRVGDRAWAQTIADRETHIIRSADVADFIPVGVEEVLLVVGKAPLRHDRAAARNDSCHAAGSHRHKAQQHARVDGEVVDALFGLFDERVAIDLPSQILGLAIDLFQCLIDRHRADRDRGVAQDPLAGGVDVFAGGKIHHGVRAPLGRPAHLLDFLFDRGSDRGVADVGVDLHQEVAADDHRFALGVVDVERNDRPAGGDFTADKLGRDLGWDALREAAEDRRRVGTGRLLGRALVLLVEVVADDVVRHIRDLGAAHVFADGDVFHLGGDDALVGVVFLGDRLTGGAQRLAAVGG